MSRIIKIVTSFVASFAILAGFFIYAAPVAGALETGCEGFDCLTDGDNVDEIQTRTGNDDTVGSLALTITNTLLYLLGAVALIMIVYGGFRYTTSGGDSNATQNAKNTILYAVIGLVVALLAYAIVNFVLVNLATPGATTTPTGTGGTTPRPQVGK